jgi:hypothetical protein
MSLILSLKSPYFLFFFFFSHIFILPLGYSKIPSPFFLNFYFLNFRYSSFLPTYSFWGLIDTLGHPEPNKLTPLLKHSVNRHVYIHGCLLYTHVVEINSVEGLYLM